MIHMNPKDYNNSSKYPCQSSGSPWDKPWTKNPYTPWDDTPYDKPFSDDWVKDNPWMKELNEKVKNGKKAADEKKKAIIDAIWVCINWKRIPKKLLKKT